MPVPNDWKVGILLVNCFYRLDPILRPRFNELLCERIIDKVVWGMIREDLFPEWFMCTMSFDSSRSQLNGLREALTGAATDCLIGMNNMSSDYYFIDFTKAELAGMAIHVGLTERGVRKLAKELNNRLLNTD